MRIFYLTAGFVVLALLLISGCISDSGADVTDNTTAGAESVEQGLNDTGAETISEAPPEEMPEKVLPEGATISVESIDIEKELYDGLLNPLVEKLRPGGILIADNLLSHAEDLAAFREHAEAHPELECQLIPIPKGELLCRKKTK